MVVVDNLHEGLDSGSLGDPLLAHTLGDLQGVSFDTGNDGVGVRSATSTLVKVLDDNGFFAGESSGEDQDNFARLQELDHCVCL